MNFTLKWLGHASLQIIIDDKVIYIDPYEGEYESKADIILITHPHFDHYNASIIQKISKIDTMLISPNSCKGKIERRIHTSEANQKISLEIITIQTVHAYNYKRFRTPGVPYHQKESGFGYLITAKGKTIYHAGDTDFVPEMKALKNIDVAFLPIGGTYTMDTQEAAEAAMNINPENNSANT